MRKIKFRGKRKYCDEWVEGYYSYLFNEKEKEYIHEITVQLFGQANMDYPYPTCETISCEVIPETVGQFTGLTDKNGKEAYEGDIVKVVNSYDEVDPLDSDTGIGEVIFLVESGLWYISSTIHNSLFDINDSYYIEIIGNIHDNPSLLTNKE